jgi:hypothetical protein
LLEAAHRYKEHSEVKVLVVERNRADEYPIPKEGAALAGWKKPTNSFPKLKSLFPLNEHKWVTSLQQKFKKLVETLKEFVICCSCKRISVFGPRIPPITPLKLELLSLASPQQRLCT